MNTVWVLGDQCSRRHAGLERAERRRDRVLFIESKPRGRRLRYHKKKLVLIFSAMRHFAEELQRGGWTVDYYRLGAVPDFQSGLSLHVERTRPDRILVMEPNDWTSSQFIKKLSRSGDIPLEVVATNQFLISREEFREWARDKARLVMEQHYRRMRKKLKLLVNERGEPEGGAWNFDPLNRGSRSEFRRSKTPLPPLLREEPDAMTHEVMEMVAREFPDHPGDVSGFWLPTHRAAAERWLMEFCRERFAGFGRWQDLMLEGEPQLFHSVLSSSLNSGLLHADDCLKAAVAAYEEGAPLQSVEGFIRQIAGWREFINGVFWHQMPEYVTFNALEAERPLPDWFYTGDTEMNCLRQSLKQAIETGFNHHIQRLMVLGNFLLVAGISPTAALRWYSEMYVDAYEWVMAANVLGMILFADGGYMATKPYAASGSYINKMSDYCAGCRFKPTEKLGDDACPFNLLYWHFYDTHAKTFEDNPRVTMMVKAWRARDAREREAILRQARAFLEREVEGRAVGELDKVGAEE